MKLFKRVKQFFRNFGKHRRSYNWFLEPSVKTIEVEKAFNNTISSKEDVEERILMDMVKQLRRGGKVPFSYQSEGDTTTVKCKLSVVLRK